MKSKFWGFMVLVFLLMATQGMFAAGQSEDNYVVGVALNQIQDEFMTKLNNGILEQAEKYDNLTVRIVEAGGDPTKQLSQVEQFVATDVDVILLNSSNKEASATAVQAAVDAGIPIVTLNAGTTPEAQALCASYVGSDYFESGSTQLGYVVEDVLQGEGRIAYMNGMMGHEAQIGRKDGAMSILNQYPDIEIVLEGDTDWDRSKGLALTENWIQSGVEFDLVVAQDVNIGMGAVIALREAGLIDDIKVSCIDVSVDGIKALRAGEVTNLVFQDAYGQGAGGVDIAMRIINGEDVPEQYLIPYELVTLENVDEYIGR